MDQGASQGGQAQGVPGHLLHGCAGHEAQWERGDEQDGDARHGNHHEEVSGGAAGLGRLREALHPELPDDPEQVQGLRPLGRNDMAREWRRGRGSAPGSPCEMAGCSGSTCQNSAAQGAHDGGRLPDQGGAGEVGQEFECQWLHGQGGDIERGKPSNRAPGEDTRGHGGHHGGDAPRDGGTQGREAPQEPGEVRGRCHDRWLLQHGVREADEGYLSESEPEGLEEVREVRQCMSASQRLSAQLKSTQVKLLGPLQARSIEEQAWKLVPEIFQALTGHNRVCLMECACEHDSLLSTAVQAQQKDEGATVRCSLFNGCDLSGDAGVRLIMRRIDLEKPQHVWLSPPCGPFSPLQRTNQRDPQQVSELKTKRKEALRIYVGTTCVMHYAIQRGTHVTLELAERSDAWRLPVLSQLQKKYQLFQAITKGCSVGLRDAKTGQALQKGWKILTTHKRLAEAMDLPCKCPKSYQHGKCEGANAMSSARYTEDYARRAARMICQELSHHDTIRECQGSSFLVLGFGEGEFCTCGEISIPGVPRTCPCCLVEKDDLKALDRDEQGLELDVTSERTQGLGSQNQVKDVEIKGTFPGKINSSALDVFPVLDVPSEGMQELGPQRQVRWDEDSGIGATGVDSELDVDADSPDFMTENYVEGFFSQSCVSKVEAMAEQHLRDHQYQHHHCASILEQVTFPGPSQSRGAVHKEDPRYMVLGSYAHGNHYGLTKWTGLFPTLTRYLLAYVQHWSPEPVRCSSLVINYNSKTFMHRDVHNEPHTKNYLIGVTKYQQGDLWVEGLSLQSKSKPVWRTLPNGKSQAGYLQKTCQRLITFDARKWHAVQKWQGKRVTVGAFASRGQSHLSTKDRKQLHDLGFVVGPELGGQVQEGFAVQAGASSSGGQISDEEIKRKLYLLHAATGHGSTRHMIDALKRRNADHRVLKLAQEFKCSVCQERGRVPARQVASLEALPPKFHTISADVGHWTHAQSGEQQNFMVIVDEGSRYRVARILSKGSKKTPNAATCVNYMSEGWIQMFGKPKALRLDPAGSFRSTALEEFCDRNGIFLDLIPGEAHWQNGVAEQAIQGIKTLMTKLCDQEPELSPEEALSEAVSTFNRRELVRGFSPVQHVLGHSPDETGHFVPGLTKIFEEPILNKPVEEFQKEAERRAVAEKALSDWQAQQRVKRALNSRTRPQCNYLPGDLVFFWRSQEAGKSNRHPGTNHGRFLGPARILAMESRQGSSGESRPGNAIWLVRGRRLLKCSREQLRPASHREEVVESLTPEGQAPWTFSRVAQEVGGSQYEDISQEIPSAAEWERAQDIMEEVPPVTNRVRGKRPATTPLMEAELDSEADEEMLGAGGSQPSQLRRRRQPS